MPDRLARAHRLAEVAGADPASPLANGLVRRLADGNEASIGELIITRENDRRLRTSATDWVKNGDRWTVLEIHDGGELTVQHTQHGRTVRLPADYVARSTELGYACTVHTAQGVTADTMHGIASGDESRQLIYTMMSRGRHANHLHLAIAPDGDPDRNLTSLQPMIPSEADLRPMPVTETDLEAAVVRAQAAGVAVSREMRASALR